MSYFLRFLIICGSNARGQYFRIGSWMIAALLLGALLASPASTQEINSVGSFEGSLDGWTVATPATGTLTTTYSNIQGSNVLTAQEGALFGLAKSINFRTRPENTGAFIARKPLTVEAGDVLSGWSYFGTRGYWLFESHGSRASLFISDGSGELVASLVYYEADQSAYWEHFEYGFSRSGNFTLELQINSSMYSFGNDYVGLDGLVITSPDRTLPVVTAPGAVTIKINTGEEGLPPSDSRLTTFLNGAMAVDTLDGNLTAKAVNLPPAFGLGPMKVLFQAVDKAGNVGTATSIVTLRANRLPIANNDIGEIKQGDALSVAVLDNDSDPDDDPLLVTLGQPPGYGTFTLKDGGVIEYMANKGFSGSDTFTYMISDGSGGTDYATVTIEVLASGPVVKSPQKIIIILNTEQVQVPASDSRIVTFLNGATAHDEEDGVIPAKALEVPSFLSIGVTEIRFEAVDSAENKGFAVSEIFVQVNRLPLAEDDKVQVPQGEGLLIRVTDNDSDPDGDYLTVSLGEALGHGTFTLKEDGVIEYVSDNDFSGNDSFTYTVSDGRGGTAKATVFIQVYEIPPVVRAPSSIVIVVHSGEDKIDSSDERIQAFLNGATAYDDVDGSLPAAAVDPPSVFLQGVTEVHFEAVDKNGNKGTSVSQVIIRRPMEPREFYLSSILTLKEAQEMFYDFERELTGLAVEVFHTAGEQSVTWNRHPEFNWVQVNEGENEYTGTSIGHTVQFSAWYDLNISVDRYLVEELGFEHPAVDAEVGFLQVDFSDPNAPGYHPGWGNYSMKFGIRMLDMEPHNLQEMVKNYLQIDAQGYGENWQEWEWKGAGGFQAVKAHLWYSEIGIGKRIVFHGSYENFLVTGDVLRLDSTSSEGKDITPELSVRMIDAAATFLEKVGHALPNLRYVEPKRQPAVRVAPCPPAKNLPEPESTSLPKAPSMPDDSFVLSPSSDDLPEPITRIVPGEPSSGVPHPPVFTPPPLPDLPERFLTPAEIMKDTEKNFHKLSPEKQQALIETLKHLPIEEKEQLSPFFKGLLEEGK